MKQALITGASSGIGEAIYNGLKKKGWNCIGTSRRGPDLRYDVTSGPIETSMTFDLVIHCAGIMPFNDSKMTMDVNFWGTWNILTGVVHNIVDNGCVIIIASISGMQAESDLPIYAASKAAVISLTKSIAKRWARHIRVNCISPGFFKTNLVPGDTPEELLATVPMGYEEDPKHLVNLILSIEDSKYMTGSNIVIDGGSLL